MNDVPMPFDNRTSTSGAQSSHLALDGIRVTDIVLIPVPTPQFLSFTYVVTSHESGPLNAVLYCLQKDYRGARGAYIRDPAPPTARGYTVTVPSLLCPASAQCH